MMYARCLSRNVLRRTRLPPCRHSSSASKSQDLETLLSKPTWSVASLLPKSGSTTSDPSETITPTQLHHLLRLSALPPPSTPEAEDRLLDSLSSHLHFVHAVQMADDPSLPPLYAIRDETPAAEKETEIGLDTLAEALAQEEKVGGGEWRRRIRRKEGLVKGEGEDWDVLGCAERKVGRWFVVEKEGMEGKA